ncbi:MAG: type I secretion C-terminal target domain-containing protein, partial [Azoarcus sp.]|nr:type I secretion C-terminal target domain-containing protein [Azoarcus sp.]
GAVADVTGAPRLGFNTPTLVTEHGGRVWIGPDGDFQYLAPDGGYSGPDSFQYQLMDADGSTSDWATVTFNVKEPPPASRADDYSAEEGTETSFESVLANDGSGVGATVGKVVGADKVEVNVGVNGVTIATVLGGIVTIYPDGHFDYQAPPRDHGDDESDQDSFLYRPVSGQGVSGELTAVRIDITDTAPVANDDDGGTTSYISRNAGNVITGVGEDSADRLSMDVGETRVAAIRAGEGEDVAAITGKPSLGYDTPTLVTEHGGRVWIDPDGDFQYLAPDDGYEGEDSFQYQLVDGDGSTSDWATVTLDVVAPPLAPLYAGDGEDVFSWSLADVSDSPVNTTIVGFNASEDKLDLRDLLADDANEFQFDTGHLSVTASGGSTTITVSPVDSGASDLSILVEGVDLTGGNSGQAAIDYMINNGTLVDDK